MDETDEGGKLEGDDEGAGSESAASRSCSPGPLPTALPRRRSLGTNPATLGLLPEVLAAPAASNQGNFAQFRRTLLAKRLAGESETVRPPASQRRGRPRRLSPGRVSAATAAVHAGKTTESSRARQQGVRGAGIRGGVHHRGADVPRGRPHASDATTRGRLNALTTQRRRPLSKQRIPAPAVQQRADRDSSVSRPRRPDRDGTNLPIEPCEDNCYAYCLADRVDIRKLNDLWLKSRAQAVAAQAVAAMAAAKAAAKAAAMATTGGRHRNNSGDSNENERNVGNEGDVAAAQHHEVQVVRLDKDLALLKVGRKECFVFSFGCLVCWGCTSDEAKCAREYLHGVLINSLQPRDIDEDSLFIGGRDGWPPPEIHLSSHDPPPFERIALAYALAQSVRLGSLELRIDRSIAKTRSIPETMARTGHVELTSVQVTKMIGELFVLKNQVNLHTDILDTPDIFWEHCDYEPLYLKCRLHLDMEKRVSIVNQRFEVLEDLFDVLESELNEREESRLEWVVIILCAVEAAVMALRLYTRWTYGFSYKVSSGESIATLPILGPLGYACKMSMRLFAGS